MTAFSRHSALLILLTLAGGSVTAAPGDLDNNGAVGVPDITLALRYASGLVKSNAAAITNGDVASPADGKVSLLDAARIARAASGLDPLGGGGQGNIPMLKTETFTLTVSGTKNIQLPGGFTISGTVKDSGGQAAGDSISFMPFGDPGAQGGGSSIHETTGAYQTNVLPGTYEAWISRHFEESDPGTGDPLYNYNIGLKTAPSVTVTNSNVTQNYILGSLPGAAVVTGSVTFGGSLAANLGFDSANFIVSSGNAYGSGSTTSEDGETYRAKVPAGQATKHVSAYYSEDNGGQELAASIDLSLMTPFSITAPSTTHNFVISNLVAHRGEVTAPAGQFLSGVDYNSTNTIGDYASSYSSYFFSPSGPYVAVVPPGTYTRNIDLMMDFTDPTKPSFSYVSTVTVPAGGGTIAPFTLPALPSLLNLSGKVTGPDGLPAKAYVSFTTSGPINNAYEASTYAVTEDDGTYSVRLPAGSYSVTAMPL